MSIIFNLTDGFGNLTLVWSNTVNWFSYYLNKSANQILDQKPMPAMIEPSQLFAYLSVVVTFSSIAALLWHCLGDVDRGEFCADFQNLRANSQSISSAAALVKAADFAARSHAKQTRKASGLPYILHPIGVAANLIDAGIFDVATLQAAYLHDVVEDTAVEIGEIGLRFGEKVMKIVAEVTDDKSKSKTERKRYQISSAASKSKEAKLVKLADKLYNLRDLRENVPLDWSITRVRGYFRWAKATVDKMRGTNSYLEDELDKVFASEFCALGGIVYQCLPELQAGQSNEQALEQYYAILEQDSRALEIGKTYAIFSQ